MAYTFDKSSGTDVVLDSKVGTGDDITTIYAANGTDVVTTLTFSGYSSPNLAAANWGVASGTSSDTLVADDTNDFVFWDLRTTD